MPVPELPFLSKLLGDAWIEAEVFTEKPTHLLGRWQKEKPENPWVVRHTEALVKVILSSKSINFNHEILANKIKSKADFVPTLAEMETAVYLAEQGFTVTLEPLAPQKGPDLRADWEGIPYFVEVRTVGFSEDEDRRQAVTAEVFAKLNAIPSSYQVMLTVSDEYKSGSIELRDAIRAVVECLDELKKRNAKQAVLYYVNKNEAVLRLPGAHINQTCQSIIQRENFVAKFESTGRELPSTPASLMRKHHPPKPISDLKKLADDPPGSVKDHKRLKSILDEKRRQLPEGSRGIIVLEVSELFMLSDFSVERALYGDWVVEFPRVTGPGEAVGEMRDRRNNRGFLLHTSRVSAVVIQKRSVENGDVKNKWRVYPTNRANADTIRLSLAELRRFGEVEDREHLCAEKAPDQN